MPTYQFVCDNCGDIEQLARYYGDKWVQCPECGGSLNQRFYPAALFMGKAPFSFRRKFMFPSSNASKP